MTQPRRSSLDELVQSVSDLVDHVKVLVTAIDDLRCEVEWWARNRVDQTNFAEIQRPHADSHENCAEAPSPADQLSRLEAKLKIAPRGAWPTDWIDDEPPELPVAKIVSVDEDTYCNVLDHRPAHMVDAGCDCEEGAGAPYLFGWQDDDGFYLRELTEAEAIELQTVCLAAQQVKSSAQRQVGSLPSQLVLWD